MTIHMLNLDSEDTNVIEKLFPIDASIKTDIKNSVEKYRKKNNLFE